MKPSGLLLSAPPRFQPLTGGTAVWVFMGVEVLTFGLFLLGHAWGWRANAEVFAESQALLHPTSAVRGTVLLLMASGAAYHGVLCNADRRAGQTAAWFVLAAALGGLFSINKIVEYLDPALADVTLSTNRFWFTYQFLTGLHLMHVLGGVVLFLVLAQRARRGDYGPENALTVEAGATYWHLVDVIWVLLFPILYLMHP